MIPFTKPHRSTKRNHQLQYKPQNGIAIWNTIEERKEIKKRLLNTKSPKLKETTAAQYRELDKQIKSSRRDRRQYIKQLVSEAKAAAVQKDMKMTYQIIRNLQGDQAQPGTPG